MKRNWLWGAVFLVIFLSASSCGEGLNSDSRPEASRKDPRHQCTRTYNSEDAYCEISVYELSASPQRFDGMYVTLVAYIPDVQSSLVFFNKDAAEYEDYQSSILVDMADRGEMKKAGYARFFARFIHDRSDKGVAIGFGRQLGRFNSIGAVKYIKSMSDRKRDCAMDGCVVGYVDGEKLESRP